MPVPFAFQTRPRHRRAGCQAILFLLTGLLGGPATAGVVWSVCVDQVDWHPYIHFNQGQPQGSHIALMQAAAADIGVGLDFRAMPWVRCQLQAELGEVDAIATLVYSEQRAQVLEFPPEATRTPSPFAIDQIDDVVITLTESGYRFEGDLASLPTPVRVPRGWAIAPYLRENGVAVDDGAPNDHANMFKLVRDRRGSVVASRQNAERELAGNPAFAALQISAQPVRSLAYFVAFSRKSSHGNALRQTFWQALARRRGLLHPDAEPASTTPVPPQH